MLERPARVVSGAMRGDHAGFPITPYNELDPQISATERDARSSISYHARRVASGAADYPAMSRKAVIEALELALSLAKTLPSKN